MLAVNGKIIRSGAVAPMIAGKKSFLRPTISAREKKRILGDRATGVRPRGRLGREKRKPLSYFLFREPAVSKKRTVRKKELKQMHTAADLRVTYKEVRDPATGDIVLRPVYKEQTTKGITVKPEARPEATEAKPVGGIQVVSVNGKPVEVVKGEKKLPAPLIALLAAAGLALTVF